jgi:peptide/nickel transport system permease protein
MARYIVQRLLQAILVLWGVSLIVFFLLRLAPSDPITLLLSETASPEQIAEARHELGFDRPVYVQYLVFVERVLHGDLGRSLFYKEPALDVVLRSLPNTLLLGGIAFALSIAVALPVGIVSALRRDSIWDYLGIGLALIGQAAPPYWLGIMLILVFSVKLRILPTSGSF